MAQQVMNAMKPGENAQAGGNAATKFCVNCGKSIARGAKFCSECAFAPER